MKTKILVIFFMIFIFLINVNAQVTEFYYNDHENKEGGKIWDHIVYQDNIIIAGRMFNNRKYNPFIARIDTLGREVWSTIQFDSDSLNYNYPEVFVQKIMLSGDYIYAICIVEDMWEDKKVLWKVNVHNGHIIWKRNINIDYWRYPDYLVDYDEDKFLVAYPDDYNGSAHTVLMSFIDKDDGSVLSTYHIGNLNWTMGSYGLAVDNQKNIYYSKHDTICKLSHVNNDSIVWMVTYPSITITDIRYIHIDQNDSIYLFGTNSDFGSDLVFSLSKSNGSIVWVSENTAGDVIFKDMVENDDYIFGSWDHRYSGSGLHGARAAKIHKNTGIVEWKESYEFDYVGSPGSHSGGSSGVASLDINQEGDLYATGYYGDANSGPECWGIIKMNGNDGSTIYASTITEDSAHYDDVSGGVVSCVVNNSPYFFGELQTSQANAYHRSRTTMVKLDTDSSNVLFKKYIGGTYQYPSITKQITKIGKGKTIVLKQVGRFTNIEMYDIRNALLWDKPLLKNYMFFGTSVIHASTNNIIVGGYSTFETNHFPYYDSKIDSLHFFFLDTLGNIKNCLSFEPVVELVTTDIIPIEMLFDGSSTFVFYENDNMVYCRKLSDSIISEEYSYDLRYSDPLYQTKHTLNYTDTSLLIAGYNNGRARLFEVDKNTMEANEFDTIAYCRVFNYLSEFKENMVLFGGGYRFGDEILVMYDLSTLDTLWTGSYFSCGEIKKFVFDADSSNVYTIGYIDTLGSNTQEVTIRKINTTNGHQRWSYFYSVADVYVNNPLDIAFDSFRNRVVITGSYKETASYYDPTNIFIAVLDSGGNLIKSITKQGDSNSINLGVCAHVLPNGATWIGGNYHNEEYGAAGFIYEIDSSYINVSVWQPSENHSQDVTFKVFPNPFSNQVNVAYVTTDVDSDVVINIYNLKGEKFYSHYSCHSAVGLYSHIAFLENLRGVYIVELQINDRVLTKKIIGID